MICLGIESSCDDTSLALVRDGRLLAHISASQAPVHALFGGVVPELASREHGRLIGALCDALFAEAALAPGDVDAVAVARGPGLLGSLLVGMAFAKAFALGAGARLIGVNHLHAHLLAAGIEQPLMFPALGLLVSGGHTQLYRIDNEREFTVLGTTLDDAAGEAFDKAGKMLGLPYPAGKFMDELGARQEPVAKMFPRPYLDNDTLNFSFSGLKTAMSAYLAKHGVPPLAWDVATASVRPEAAGNTEIQRICASYTQAVVDTLVAKTRKALERESGIRSLILAGGVAANSALRGAMQALATDNGLVCQTPSVPLCADNGAMIAHLGSLLAAQGYFHPLSVEAIPRGRRIPDDMCRAHATAL